MNVIHGIDERYYIWTPDPIELKGKVIQTIDLIKMISKKNEDQFQVLVVQTSLIQIDMILQNLGVINIKYIDLIPSKNKDISIKNQIQYLQNSFTPNQFDWIFDSGTMDILLCEEDGTQLVAQLLDKYQTILTLGGVCQLISYIEPFRRLNHLQRKFLQWEVTYYRITKECTQFFAILAALLSDKRQTDTTDQTRFNYYYYIYECKKQMKPLLQKLDDFLLITDDLSLKQKEYFPDIKPDTTKLNQILPNYSGNTVYSERQDLEQEVHYNKNELEKTYFNMVRELQKKKKIINNFQSKSEKEQISCLFKDIIDCPDLQSYFTLLGIDQLNENINKMQIN